MTWRAFRGEPSIAEASSRSISVRKTTSFPIPLFTVGIRPSLSLGLISVLNISLRNFQGRCLLFSYQGSLFCFRISATTSISYHVASDLSTTFSSFFFLFSKDVFADVAKPRSRAALIRQKIHPLAWWIFIISS